MPKQSKAPKATQATMPGTEPTIYPEVNEAAEHYLGARDDAKAAAEFKKDAAESLVQKMRARNLLHYRDPQRGLTVELDTADKVRVVKDKGAE